MTRVLIVDDSASMREALRALVEQDGDLSVVGAAPDPVVAWQLVKQRRPDVISLDIEMPRMDGLQFLDALMRHAPVPVVMVSSLTQRGAEATLRALELGAVDVVPKPAIDVVRGIHELGAELRTKLRMAAGARVRVRTGADAPPPVVSPGPGFRATHKVIAIGASTGGTQALADVLARLPPDAPGIVLVQHMPPSFTRSFAERLDSLCRVRVAEASHGDRILPGHVLIAPGGRQMRVRRDGASYRVEVFDGPRVNRHAPSVDVLFESCAEQLGKNAVGVILTGMGDDGARGLAQMRAAGAHTIAQDEASCVVFGMPREAIERGAAVTVLPLDRIAPAMLT